MLDLIAIVADVLENHMWNPWPVVILEGPDGAGKSTLAEFLKPVLGAKFKNVSVQHHGSYSKETDISRHYIESILQARSGQHTVIMDRSWLSDSIYGKVYRGGLKRVSDAEDRVLAVAGLGCPIVVVFCLPPKDVCLKVFESRSGEEMLDNVAQLSQVYDGYVELASSYTRLPKIMFDRTKTSLEVVSEEICKSLTCPRR